MATAGQALYRTGATRFLPKGRKMVPDLLRRLAEGEELFWSGTFIFDEVNKKRLLTPEARKRLKVAADGNVSPSSYSVVRSDLDLLTSSEPNADQLLKMIYQELKLRLPELLLMRVDKMTMATSVEARVPYLDHKLVEFAMSIPSGLKYKHGETKYILKRALSGIIPDRVLKREKQGFGVPINEWMLDKLGSFVEHSLFNSALRRRELFDYSFVRQMLRGHRARSINYSIFLWSLLNLSLWYDQWIDGSRARNEPSTPLGVKEEVLVS
jgi:asparagine synthase (glutamine-hydrolysing)